MFIYVRSSSSASKIVRVNPLPVPKYCYALDSQGRLVRRDGDHLPRFYWPAQGGGCGAPARTVPYDGLSGVVRGTDAACVAGSVGIHNRGRKRYSAALGLEIISR